jgi:RecG-like helicase
VIVWLYQLQNLIAFYQKCIHYNVLSLQIMIFVCVNLTLFLVQQYSKQLEDTMEKFALGEIKILISTNIVESGLDIQNANTIIIQDVQQFGLAQLYQVFFPY